MTISPVASIAAAAGSSLVGAASKSLADATGSFVEVLRSALDRSEDATKLHRDKLHDRAEAELVQFRTILQDRLDEAGVTTLIEFQLAADAMGGVRIVGDHPFKQQIEQVLAADPQLADAFHRLGATYNELRAADGEPVSPHFRLTIDGDAAEVSFD